MRIETLNPVSGIPALLLNFKFGIFVSEIFTRFEILVIFLSWNTLYVILFGSYCVLSPTHRIIYLLSIHLFISRVNCVSFMLDIVIKKSFIFVNTFKSFLSWTQSVHDVRLLLSWEGSVALEREISGCFESTHWVIDCFWDGKIFVKDDSISDFEDRKIRMVIGCSHGDSFLRGCFEHFGDEIRGERSDRFE